MVPAEKRIEKRKRCGPFKHRKDHRRSKSEKQRDRYESYLALLRDAKSWAGRYRGGAMSLYQRMMNGTD